MQQCNAIQFNRRCSDGMHAPVKSKEGKDKGVATTLRDSAHWSVHMHVAIQGRMGMGMCC